MIEDRSGRADDGAVAATTATVARLEHELRMASAALDEPGAGAQGNLECRVADLQQRVLTTPARTLSDIEARLSLIRAIAASLGEPGYLVQLVDATLADVRAMHSADE